MKVGGVGTSSNGNLFQILRSCTSKVAFFMVRPGQWWHCLDMCFWRLSLMVPEVFYPMGARNTSFEHCDNCKSDIVIARLGFFSKVLPFLMTVNLIAHVE